MKRNQDDNLSVTAKNTEGEIVVEKLNQDIMSTHKEWSALEESLCKLLNVSSDKYYTTFSSSSSNEQLIDDTVTCKSVIELKWKLLLCNNKLSDAEIDLLKALKVYTTIRMQIPEGLSIMGWLQRYRNTHKIYILSDDQIYAEHPSCPPELHIIKDRPMKKVTLYNIPDSEALRVHLEDNIKYQEGVTYTLARELSPLKGQPFEGRPFRTLVMLASGISGTGKGGTADTIRSLLDMQEQDKYSKRYIVCRLNGYNDNSHANMFRGSPVGYAGHEKRCTVDSLIDAHNDILEQEERESIIYTEKLCKDPLTRRIALKRHFNTIFLFIDEIDKPPVNFLEGLMGLFETQSLESAKGSKFQPGDNISLLVFMTANFGVNQIVNLPPNDEDSYELALVYIRKHMIELGFSPWILGRIKTTLAYLTLPREAIVPILYNALEREITKNAKVLKGYVVDHVVYTKEIKDRFVDLSIAIHGKYEPSEGVRVYIDRMTKTLDETFENHRQHIDKCVINQGDMPLTDPVLDFKVINTYTTSSPVRKVENTSNSYVSVDSSSSPSLLNTLDNDVNDGTTSSLPHNIHLHPHPNQSVSTILGESTDGDNNRLTLNSPFTEDDKSKRSIPLTATVTASDNLLREETIEVNSIQKKKESLVFQYPEIAKAVLDNNSNLRALNECIKYNVPTGIFTLNHDNLRSTGYSIISPGKNVQINNINITNNFNYPPEEIKKLLLESKKLEVLTKQIESIPDPRKLRTETKENIIDIVGVLKNIACDFDPNRTISYHKEDEQLLSNTSSSSTQKRLKYSKKYKSTSYTNSDTIQSIDEDDDDDESMDIEEMELHKLTKESSNIRSSTKNVSPSPYKSKYLPRTTLLNQDVLITRDDKLKQSKSLPKSSPLIKSSKKNMNTLPNPISVDPVIKLKLLDYESLGTVYPNDDDLVTQSDEDDEDEEESNNSSGHGKPHSSDDTDNSSYDDTVIQALSHQVEDCKGTFLTKKQRSLCNGCAIEYKKCTWRSNEKCEKYYSYTKPNGKYPDRCRTCEAHRSYTRRQSK